MASFAYSLYLTQEESADVQRKSKKNCIHDVLVAAMLAVGMTVAARQEKTTAQFA